MELFPTTKRLEDGAGVTNSAVTWSASCGQLQYYLGAVLGGTHYIRNREDEFSRRSGTRNQLILEIQTTVHTVRAVVPTLPPDAFSRVFPEKVFGRDLRTDRFLLHLCTHAAYHLAQAGYLRRIVTGLNQTSGPFHSRHSSRNQETVMRTILGSGRGRGSGFGIRDSGFGVAIALALRLSWARGAGVRRRPEWQRHDRRVRTRANSLGTPGPSRHVHEQG